MQGKLKISGNIFVIEGAEDMDKQRCERCNCEEYIPTHQYVKFEDRIRYLCQQCWELFKGWYVHGTRSGHSYADADTAA